MSVPKPNSFPTIFRGLLRNWRKWGRNPATVAELSRLDAADVEGVARDVGLTSADLRTLAGKWPDSAELLSQRIAGLHIDERKLCDEKPKVLRDMQRTCALCVEKRQCEHDLDRQVKDLNWEKYCPNTTTIRSLLAERNSPTASSVPEPDRG